MDYLNFCVSVILCAGLAVQVYEDIKEGYLFDEVSLGLGVIGLGRAVYLGHFTDSCFGFGLALLALGVLYCCADGGMGLGDVFLAAATGFWLGLWPTVVMLMVTFILGGFLAVVLLLMGKSRKTSVPFAPFLAVGTLAAYWYGMEIVNWYFRMFL